jgi:hypothetical protein
MGHPCEAGRGSWFGLFAFAGLAIAGCAPQIGSSCTLSTDCSSQGDRACDTAQPGGYCTILNCDDMSCPNHAACVAFDTSIPGCPNLPYNAYQQPARTSVAFCMEQCASDSDCRSGYVCRSPLEPPWNAAILDDDQHLAVCIAATTFPLSDASIAPTEDGSVCSMSLPPIPEETGAAEVGPPVEGGADSNAGSSDAAAAGAVDGSADAGSFDAAGVEAGSSDGASVDAPEGVPAEAGSFDAAGVEAGSSDGASVDAPESVPAEAGSFDAAGAG